MPSLPRVRRKLVTPPVLPPQLIYSRKQVAGALGVSTYYIMRLEEAGSIQGIRLGTSPNSMVFFRAEEVQRFLDEAEEAGNG